MIVNGDPDVFLTSRPVVDLLANCRGGSSSALSSESVDSSAED